MAVFPVIEARFFEGSIPGEEAEGAVEAETSDDDRDQQRPDSREP